MAENINQPPPVPKGVLDKAIPTVTMCSPWQPVVERFVVPAAWFAAGMLVCKLISKPTVHKVLG